MELRQIIYFIEVAKREHVTDAANALHVAQSAISRQIFNLEAELGVDLFIREGRNVRLTPIGRIFLNHMEEAVQVINHAKQVVEEYTDPQRGTVRVGFPSSLASYILPNAISAFREEYPDVNFNLNQGSYHDLVDSVIRGDINLAVLGPIPQNKKKLTTKILFTERLIALLPSSHPLARRRSLTVGQLQNDAFVMFPKGYVLRDLAVDACAQQGFQPTVSFEGRDIDSIKGLVSAGLGVSLVPEITLFDSIPRTTVRIPIVDPEVTRTVGVIKAKGRDLLPTEEVFYDFLVQFFRRLEDFQN